MKLKSYIFIISACVLIIITAPFTLFSDKPESLSIISPDQPAGTLDPSLQNELNAAIDRAYDWLAANQKEDGTWSNAKFPALTALPTWAFASGTHPQKKKILKKAKKYIISCAQKDGGIYKHVEGVKGGGLSNYNTAISMTALHATGDRSLDKIIQNARKFIAGAQHLGDDLYKGGFGYDKDTGREYTDLLNSFYSVQAMALTSDVEDTRPQKEKKADLDWTETVKYIESMQNKPGAGKEDAGGFFYRPGESKAGTTTNKAGTVVFRSYGSMTYVGLLALVYANVSREDVRIQSAFDWSTKHWSLEENPGMGAQGLFFFYYVLSRSLSAYGIDQIPLPNNSSVNWKKELALKLIKMQKVDSKGRGYWTNENGRFWEQDPVLCTSYALLALQML